MVCIVVIWNFVSMSHHPGYQKCDLDDDSDDDNSFEDKDGFDNVKLTPYHPSRPPLRSKQQ